MIMKLIIVLLCTMLYTVIRYVIFGHISSIHMPIYLINKSVSMATVFFLIFTALSHSKDRMEKMRFWGTASLLCAYIHILLSFAILSSFHYPKFFDIEKINLTGKFTILYGALAALLFWSIRNVRSGFMLRRKFQLLSCLFVAAHLVAMGFVGWLKVEKWYGGLPPISLLSFVFVIISLVFFLKSKEENPS